MTEMAENMARCQVLSVQNQSSSSSMEVSTSVPQWFDMEAPGGVGVGERPKVPALALPLTNNTSDASKGIDSAFTPLGGAVGGASGGGGGGGDPNTKAKKLTK
eukprot:7382031-Karenia_brevis.AAC.1